MLNPLNLLSKSSPPPPHSGIRAKPPTTAAMESLPPEVIMDILLLLPVKSLCRFRCVCKSWLALINDHRFVEMHLARTGTRNQHLVLTAGLVFSYDLLIERCIESTIGRPSFDANLYAKSLYSVDLQRVGSDDGNKFITVEMDLPFRKQNQGRISIMGSCNGLLCIMPERDEFCVFNPCTREYKLIPDFDQPRLEYASGTAYGFGFSKLVDDYKFVKIACNRRVIQLYSLRNDSWRSVLNDVYVTDNCKPGICLNGAIHWICGNVEGQGVIAAFDLVEEKFEMLPFPDSVNERYKLCNVGLLSDWLCLIPRKLGWVNEFWVMKDYGVKESWTRMSLACNFHLMRPLCLLKKSGKMLLHLNNSMLVLCDQEDNSMLVLSDQEDGNVERVRLDGNFRNRFHGDVYVESLVSPNYDNHFKSEEKLLQCWFK